MSGISPRSSVWPVAEQTSRAQRQQRYLPEPIAHPGKMLPALARQAIETYSQPGELVLYPMCAIGTTLVEAIPWGANTRSGEARALLGRR